MAHAADFGPPPTTDGYAASLPASPAHPAPLQHPFFCTGKVPSLISKAIQVLLISHIPGLIVVPVVVS